MTAPERTGRSPLSTSEPAASDQELLARAREGEAEAFRGLVERYEGTVAATVIGMLGPGADADDVGQEVFLRFYRALHRFRGEASLKTYLTRIAINVSLNAIKKRKTLWERFVSRDRDPDEAPLREPAVSGERQLAAREASDLVHAAIARLQPEFRAVTVLRLVEGHSTRETAELLGIPEGTVTSRLARATKQLRQWLGPHVMGRQDDAP